MFLGLLLVESIDIIFSDYFLTSLVLKIVWQRMIWGRDLLCLSVDF